MAKEYNQETLKRVQQCEMGIFADFAKICKENDLTYFGFSGTGIGALRHQGFIPWDDDIDVAMPREDYDTLIAILDRDYRDTYTVVTAERFDDYPLMTTRITLNDSLFVENAFRKVKKAPLGIFLDLYPLENCRPDDKKYRKHEILCFIYTKLLILKHIPFPYLPFKGFKAKLAHGATAVVWFFLNLFCIRHSFLYRRALAHAKAYRGQEADYYEYFPSQKLFHIVYKKTDIFPLQALPFEDTVMNFPSGLDGMLKNEYGDYMRLPPPEKRKNHIPYRLKFPGDDTVISGEE